MRVEGATYHLWEIVRGRNMNLSELSRRSGVPYYRLYRSKPDVHGVLQRELGADEFLSVCACLGVNPGEFLPDEKAASETAAGPGA